VPENKVVLLDERAKDEEKPFLEQLLQEGARKLLQASPFPEGDKRRFGHSRDKRSDCVQVVIALIITPEGLPLTYEVLSGNTADKTTLRDFLKKIENQYGKAVGSGSWTVAFPLKRSLPRCVPAIHPSIISWVPPKAA
jgi:hypothetical protein